MRVYVPHQAFFSLSNDNAINGIVLNDVIRNGGGMHAAKNYSNVLFLPLDLLGEGKLVSIVIRHTGKKRSCPVVLQALNAQDAHNQPPSSC